MDNPNAPPENGVYQIEVENFKSYSAHQVIGPFKKFTAVVGPNGSGLSHHFNHTILINSGKSNLLDAISFVLGVKTAQLRYNNLKDLVSRSVREKLDSGSVQCYVKMIYLDRKEQVSFMRSITAKGKAEYRINNQQVNVEAYHEKLMSYNVIVKARNFLILQVS